MEYTIKRVMTEQELEQAFSVRKNVFIEEQNVPEDLELDEYDHTPTTTHLLATDDQGLPVGTARFRPYTEEGVCKIERVAVLAHLRGSGLGKRIMESIHELAKQMGYTSAKLNAQLHAQPFYTRLGYEAEGDVFLEAHIEHVAMKKNL